MKNSSEEETIEQDQNNGETVSPSQFPSLIQSCVSTYYLEDTWNLWIVKHCSNKLKKLIYNVVYFESLEQFEIIINALKPPSKLINGKIEYYIFKKGIKPTLGDPTIKKGGKWTLNECFCKEGIDYKDLWHKAAKFAIKPDFEYAESIFGVSLELTNQNYMSISIWNKCSYENDNIFEVGEKIHKVLDLPEGGLLEYYFHPYVLSPNPLFSGLPLPVLRDHLSYHL